MTRTFVELRLFSRRWNELGLDDRGIEEPEEFIMSTLFDDLKQGLHEAIQYEKGQGSARTRTYMITPIREYTGEEIRSIRRKTGMTQGVFASYMGVSKKTIEAWEGGRTHPTGPVFRLLEYLDNSDIENTQYIVEKE